MANERELLMPGRATMRDNEGRSLGRRCSDAVYLMAIRRIARQAGDIDGPARCKLLAATPTAFHPRPLWTSTLNFRIPPPMVPVLGGCGPFGHLAKCARIWRQSAKCARIRLAVSCSPQPQPHFHP